MSVCVLPLKRAPSLSKLSAFRFGLVLPLLTSLSLSLRRTRSALSCFTLSLSPPSAELDLLVNLEISLFPSARKFFHVIFLFFFLEFSVVSSKLCALQEVPGCVRRISSCSFHVA